MAISQEGRDVELVFRTAAVSPKTSVSNNGLLKVEGLELSGNRVKVEVETENNLRLRRGPFQSHIALDPRYSKRFLSELII